MPTEIDRLETSSVKRIVEGALMAADEPLSVDRLFKLFRRGELDPAQGRSLIREALRELGEEAAGRGYELKRVASGFRFQVRGELSEWISRLWEEKPPRYSRALLETLALVAYKQPVTRGDIEQVRGVAVSQGIVRTLLERGWMRVVGQRETPGRPNLYGTTRAFLDYFNLKSLEELPSLAEIRAMIEPLVEDKPGDTPQASLELPEQGEADTLPAEAGKVSEGGKVSEAGAIAEAGAPISGNDEPDQEPAEAGQHLAEVVRLPTATRQTGSPQGE